MTMHLIVGDGELPKKELVATLTDLQDKAAEADEEFWFTVIGKAEPTNTDKNLIDWLASSELYYEVLTDVAEDELDDIYAGRQKLHTAKKLATKAVNLLKGADEGPADVLALFVNLKEESDDDALLADIVQAAIDAEFEAFGLNDSMVKIDLTDDGEEEEEEEKPAPSKAAASKKAAPAKSAAKKAPASKKAAPRASGPRVYTEAELDEMTDAEVRAVGSSLGITTRGRDNWISKIMAKQGATAEEEEEEEVAAAPSGNGSEDAMEVTNGAMVIVINNGSIVARALTNEGAKAVSETLLAEWPSS